MDQQDVIAFLSELLTHIHVTRVTEPPECSVLGTEGAAAEVLYPATATFDPCQCRIFLRALPMHLCAISIR